MYISSWMQGLVPSLLQPLFIFIQPRASISGYRGPDVLFGHYHGEKKSAINGSNAQTPRVLRIFLAGGWMDLVRAAACAHYMYTVRFTTRTGEERTTAWLWPLSAKLFATTANSLPPLI
jgi:hypothetical protein